MSYQFDFSVITSNWKYLASGLRITAEVTVYSLVIGALVGITIGIMRSSKNGLVRRVAMAYISVFRNTPALVQLFWVYYCLPMLIGIQISAVTSCVIALSAGAAAYIAEIMRAGIQAIDKGQLEAASTIGLSWSQTMRKIVLPQAFRQMVPPLVNEIVTLLKFSSLVSVLGVQDMTYNSQVLSSTTFRPIELYTALGVQYYVVCLLVSRFAAAVEKRMAIGA